VSKRITYLLAITVSVAALLAGSLPAPSFSATAAGPQAQPTPFIDGRTFPETGKTVTGRFLEYWTQNGGLAQQGYPISEEIQERSDLDGKTYTVQYFERAVFERHPENRPPYDVLLSQLGTFRYRDKYPNGAPGQKASAVNSRRFAETGKSVGGKFREYWERNGGLAQQGFPISEEFTEKSELDGKQYTVQYFERAVFEYHPENELPYDVLLSQLGTFRYRAKYGAATAANLTEFYERAFLDILLRDPETYTGVGLPASVNPGYRHNKLTPLGDAYVRETGALVRQYLDRLRAYDKSSQTPQQRISTAIMEWHLDDLVRGQQFAYHDYPFNVVTGVQISLEDMLVNLHPLRNKQDAEDYVARLNEVGAKFDGGIEQLRLREQKGVFMPRWMVQFTSGSMRQFASGPATSNELYTTFKARVQLLSSVSPPDQQALFTAAERAIRDVVYPAYIRVADELDRQASKSRSTDGVWALPDGDAYYRYLVRHHTGTDMTPEEIHNLGLAEVQRIRDEMQALLDELGQGGKSFRDAMSAAAQAGGIYDLTRQGEQTRLLGDFKSAIDKASRDIAPYFDLKPRVAVEVRPVPPERAGAPGGYYFQPAMDGSRPGIFYVNLNGQSYARYALPTLAYHEGVPGHHFQLGIQSELTGVPTFQRSGVFPQATSYVEGWALYAEKLADEAGFYRDDRYGELGRLEAELFRAARLVVDTGIHWKRWTRAQANTYMEDTLGKPANWYAGEVVRYTAWPGQALAYKMGELKILELREQAKQALGAKFDLKQFHNVVLQSGSMPLPVLEQAVDTYIARGR
jgi:uncharacterized protein (DUF885 family)